jgi:predicted DNA-binding transcriptional regulator YafY
MEGRRKENIKDLACQLGVSVRTVKYDVEALMTEYPIETARGHGGCVMLPSGFREYKGDITVEQQNALLSAISVLDKAQAKVLCELLHAHGSIRSKEKFEEVIKNAQ